MTAAHNPNKAINHRLSEHPFQIIQTPEEVWSFEVPRATPILYHFDAGFRPLRLTGTGGGGDGNVMHLPPQITATVLLPTAEGEGEEGWAARLPSNS